MVWFVVEVTAKYFPSDDIRVGLEKLSVNLGLDVLSGMPSHMYILFASLSPT